MAMKDWKKIEETKDKVIWESKKDGDIVGIWLSGGVISPKKEWFLDTPKKQDQKIGTKAQALKKARQYMRKH